MHFINWGSESPEQLAIRRRIEEQALYEQAVRAAMQRAGQAPAVGGGSADPFTDLYGVGISEADARLYSLGRSQAEWQINGESAPDIFQAALNTDDGFLYAVLDLGGGVTLVKIDRQTRDLEFVNNDISDYAVKGAASFYYEGEGSFIYLDNSEKNSSVSSIIRVQLQESPEFGQATELAEVDSNLTGYLLRNLFLYDGYPWAIAYSGPDIITGPIDLNTGNFGYSNLVLPSPAQPEVQAILGVFSTIEYKGKVLCIAVWDDGDTSRLGLFEMDTETGGSITPYYLKFLKNLEDWSKDDAAILSLTTF
jgi:hypothetical protein